MQFVIVSISMQQKTWFWPEICHSVFIWWFYFVQFRQSSDSGFNSFIFLFFFHSINQPEKAFLIKLGLQIAYLQS